MEWQENFKSIIFFLVHGRKIQVTLKKFGIKTYSPVLKVNMSKTCSVWFPYVEDY